MITYLAEINDFNDDNVTVSFSFGINDGSGLKTIEAINYGENFYGVNYTYTNGGKYLLNVFASDGTEDVKSIHLIEVINIPPYAKIRTYQNTTYEVHIHNDISLNLQCSI